MRKARLRNIVELRRYGAAPIKDLSIAYHCTDGEIDGGTLIIDLDIGTVREHLNKEDAQYVWDLQFGKIVKESK